MLTPIFSIDFHRELPLSPISFLSTDVLTHLVVLLRNGTPIYLLTYQAEWKLTLLRISKTLVNSKIQYRTFGKWPLLVPPLSLSFSHSLISKLD